MICFCASVIIFSRGNMMNILPFFIIMPLCVSISNLSAGDLQHEVDDILNNDNREPKTLLRTPPIGTRHCEELEELRHSGDQYYAECFKSVRKEIVKAIIMPPAVEEDPKPT